jgi:hypothetical protein
VLNWPAEGRDRQVLGVPRRRYGRG